METNQVDKEVYRTIIENYFDAFGTRDFSRVQFSSRIEFLSPISGITMKGREAVTNFVSGVSTRVSAVNILSIAVDFPTASGVWQMRTTKGGLYTLHNFFRLDEQGLAYIWPMFDPKAVMNDPPALLQWLRGEGYYEVAGITDQQPTGVAVSNHDRLFVNFPRHAQDPFPSVGEIVGDGSLVPYPNVDMNRWDGKPGNSARNHFVCVHTVHVDAEDMLWVLDPASPNHQGVVPGGAKLVKVNLATSAVERVYPFDTDVAPPGSYLNKVRFARGFAFITDSDLGAIVVLNLNSGESRRLLDNHYSTKCEPGVPLAIDGNVVKFAPVHADGIAVDPSSQHVYWKALIGRTLYRISVSTLLNESLSPEELGDQVQTVAVSEPTGGIEFDGEGNLYLTAVQEDAIKVLRLDGRIEFFARATDFLWPDTIAISCDGKLVFTASQLHLMPTYNAGVDKRMPPYKIFRLQLKPQPADLPPACEEKTVQKGAGIPFDRDSFLRFCCEITGYSAFDLEGTGLIDTYHRLIQDVLGEQLTNEFGEIVHDILGYPPQSTARQNAIRDLLLTQAPHRPVISALISLWYLGVWNQLPTTWYAAVGLPIPGPKDPGRTHVPSALAYIEQLSYRTAWAHPPGAKATGFGSWSRPPAQP